MKTIETMPLESGTVLIVGAGLAGLYTALKLAPRRVVVITSGRTPQGSASSWAQGGIACALGDGDSPDLHARDTIQAGGRLVDEDMVRLMVNEAKAGIADLQSLGVPFDCDDTNKLALGLEAAHSHRRIVHVKGDQAGREIMNVMIKHARAAPHIRALTDMRAESLLRTAQGGIGGVMTRNDAGQLRAICADATILATGGVGGLFALTTNPKSARGDAIGMAVHCGVMVRDLEFVQFHPTALDVGIDPAPLASEALRGAGARLVTANGQPFMDMYHAQGDLAPRDIVARAVFAQIQKNELPFLDARNCFADVDNVHYPTVLAACQKKGIDPRCDFIPIAPAAHYHMGGIVTDDTGRSSLDGLWALGECASVGVHGANRLASNSLLEAIVFGRRCAQALRERSFAKTGRADIHNQEWLSMETRPMRILRETMRQYCGVRRNHIGLRKALDCVENLIDEVGMANPLLCARLIVQNALVREESLGAHYRDDFPPL